MPTPTDSTAAATSAESDSTSSGPPVIDFVDVEKRFGDNVVLKDLNFSVARGERVTLIGPSGSGKTTILRLVMTLEELTGGYIYIDGEALSHEERDGKRVEVSKKAQKQLRTRIGMVFQQFNLFPNMTVLENIIEAPIHVLGRSKKDAVDKAHSLLEQVGLSRQGQRPPHQSLRRSAAAGGDRPGPGDGPGDPAAG